jgi:hypothetical protein
VAELAGRGMNARQETAVVNVKETVRKWFAEMSLTYHPDRFGGDGREMKVVNAAFERLKAMLEMNT